MRLRRLAVLYTALLIGANAAMAEGSLSPDLLTGAMAKLVPTSDPLPVPPTMLVSMNDAPTSIEEWGGKVRLVNFWATWCAPCRKELPALEALEAELGGGDFDVITIAAGPNPVPAIKDLFADLGITRLPVLRDPDMGFAREMGVAGLPVSILLDRNGTEVARLVGDADWASDEAKAVIRALIAQGG